MTWAVVLCEADCSEYNSELSVMTGLISLHTGSPGMARGTTAVPYGSL